MHEIDSEYEFSHEQNASFLENIVVEYQCLIEKYMKSYDVFESQKIEINFLCEEKINYIEKNFGFLSLSINLSLREMIL